MCAVSMIMQHKWDEWYYRYLPSPTYLPTAPPPTPAEIDEFRRLLERAREYDREHNQPDCELEEKRRKLLNLAEELGVGEAVERALGTKGK